MTMKPLNKEEKITNFETMKHISMVTHFINIIIVELLNRAEQHDKTKLSRPEVEGFTEYTPKLADCEYGSEEYKRYLEELKPALEHHYARNRHHPEHFKNGIEDMTLIDIVEMICDWKSSTLRHHDGNLLKSIEINSERFKMTKQLTKILENTAELFESKTNKG